MSLMHNIRLFAEHKLQGVIPWSAFSFPDDVKSDVANCSIEGKKGLYRITVTSSYANPPLGHVKFTDHGTGHEIEGDNQDGAWHQIAEYLKAREAGDPLLEILPPPSAILGNVARTLLVAHLPVNELPIPSVALVWFIANPGEWYRHGPAFVTRINGDGSYNLTVFPDGSEPFYQQNVQAKSDVLKNVCWVPYAAHESTAEPIMEHVDDGKLAEMRAMLEDMQNTISRLKASCFDQRKSA